MRRLWHKLRMQIAIYTEPDVHLNWHMTPDEWSQVLCILKSADPAEYPYISQLHDDGMI
jgi:hypothetical protein